MAVDPSLVSMAQQFSGLPMSDLIGGPLLAAAEANGMMAVTQTKFLLDTCFSYTAGVDVTTPGTYAPIMITMELVRPVLVPVAPTTDDESPEPKISAVTTSFNLPLLTILPLNSLAVDNVDISFDMQVKSSYSETTGAAEETDLSAATTFSSKFGFGAFSAEITGSVSYDSKTSSSRDTHYEASNSAQYSVKVHAGQLPLPQGVNIIIAAFANTIAPITMPTAGPSA